MKSGILCIVFLLFFCLDNRAQTDSVYYGKRTKDTASRAKKFDSSKLDKFNYGGDFQAYFINSYTYVYLAPTIGYTPFNNFTIGAGPLYIYASVNYLGYGRISQSVYGLHSYGRYFFKGGFFAQGQFDHLLQPNVYNYNNPEQKVWVDYTLVGGGFRRSLGKNSALITSIMINVTPNKLSIYQNPIFQIGFVGGF